MQVAGPLTVDFWLGAVVRRRFAAGWFLGTVVDVNTDEGKTFYKIDYEDFDQEELDAGELWDAVIYHPKLDTDRYHYKKLPKIQDIVLFTSEQRARLGQVTAVDPADRRPITIALLKPNSKAESLATAKYIRGLEDGHEISMQLLPLQIRTSSLQLREDGYLTAESQRTLTQMLKPRKRRKQTKQAPTSKTEYRSKTPKNRQKPKINVPISKPIVHPRKPKPEIEKRRSKTPRQQRRHIKYRLRKR